MTSLDYYHPLFKNTANSISAMNWVKETISSMDFPGKAFTMSMSYSRF